MLEAAVVLFVLSVLAPGAAVVLGALLLLVGRTRSAGRTEGAAHAPAHS